MAALSRLQTLQHEKTLIGNNAQKAVKFLDQSTSSRGNLRHDPVILQGPDEEYTTWAEVETHYLNVSLKTAGTNEGDTTVANSEKKLVKDSELPLKANGTAGGALSQMLLDKLNFAKDNAAMSPSSTPPLSPSSSGPQSSKTSPEVTAATMICQDQTPVPPTLKPLFNSVVWYVHEKKAPADQSIVFLTNSPDTMHLARDFGIPTKNIHQLRSALGMDEPEAKVAELPKKELLKKTSKPEQKTSEQKTLFSYEDAESDEEEVVFKPRGRGSARGSYAPRGSGAGGARSKGGNTRSPRLSFSTPNQPAPAKPQIPVEEIDPDSFDRGSFARGSTPLVNTSSQAPSHFNNARSGHRGNHGQGGGRGTNSGRGHGRGGGERGSARGRGRLFIP